MACSRLFPLIHCCECTGVGMPNRHLRCFYACRNPAASCHLPVSGFHFDAALGPHFAQLIFHFGNRA